MVWQVTPTRRNPIIVRNGFLRRNPQEKTKTSVLPMGSLFEGALFILFEVMVLKLMDRLSITAEDMRANHTNLE